MQKKKNRLEHKFIPNLLTGFDIQNGSHGIISDRVTIQYEYLHMFMHY